jgi:hypothetical protein
LGSFCRTQLSGFLPASAPEDRNISFFHDVLFSSEYQKMDEVQKPVNPKCHPRSSGLILNDHYLLTTVSIMVIVLLVVVIIITVINIIMLILLFLSSCIFFVSYCFLKIMSSVSCLCLKLHIYLSSFILLLIISHS